MTIQQAFEVALQHHQSGRLAEAEALYRQILAVDPRYADALHNLGVLAGQAGHHDLAVARIRQAIALKPDYPEAHSNLGNALRDLGQLDEAIAAYRRAIALKPDFAMAYSILGNALRDKGRLDEAVAAYRQAIALKPGDPEAHSDLGNVLQDQGRTEEAIAAYRQAIAFKPGDPDTHNNLGNALREKGCLDEAIAAYRQAIALKPGNAEGQSNLGNALRDKGRLDEAVAACRQAIALDPDFPEAHVNLGNALRDKGQFDEAIAACRRAIALKPGHPKAHNNLGAALHDKGRLDEAIAAYRQAIALRPDFAMAHRNLGGALQGTGCLDEAIAAFQKAIALDPERSGAHSGLVFVMNYHPGLDAQAIAEEHRRWNHRHAEPLRRFIRPHPNDRDPERRLRVGYVSPDFRDHVVGRNMLPLFAHHDHHRFEVFCYAHVAPPDAFTDRFRASADHWRSTVGVGDESLAARIREDRIDILVDLALHTAQNRLPVFARKPAPVQVTFAGYPGSTGLDTIDCRLSDPFLDPPGMDESIYSGRTVRLPHTFWCYDPLECQDLPVRDLPAQTNGHVTFGCLNNFCKVNDSVLGLWCKVLQSAPSSRLLLLAPEGSARERTLEVFRRHGIDSGRIEFVTKQPRREYLELCHRIDLALDTLPYNGHTSSLDSFWMGVPVLTLVGPAIVGRAGLSQLMNLGLPEWIAQSPEEYVKIAVERANDLPGLRELRSTLRRRMETSPLMDAPRFARDIEAAYREMWQKWCAQPPPGASS